MKKKLLIGLLGLSLFSLAACNNSIVSVKNDDLTVSNLNYIEDGNGNSNNKELKYNPVYESLDYSIDYSDVLTSSNEVEDTVEDIYDSVTSITASSTSAISRGSAVLFAKDEKLGFSYLVTCFHVIDGAYNFVVTESDNDSYEAFLVGGYEDEDLAILAIKTPEEDDLVYASLLQDSNTIKLGSKVICIGNPLGTLPGSVSSGVVSYKNREISVDTYQKRSLIQTDVAINSGNSGGGLFNIAGNLIGIVSAKYSSSGIEGLGFAIPSNTVIDTIQKIMTTAKYDTANEVFSTGYYEGDYEFGFNVSVGTYQTGSFGQIQRYQVLYISSILLNSSATGYNNLAVNDIINNVSIDFKDENEADVTNKTFTSAVELMQFLYESNLKIGDTITFNITRSNQKTDVSFKVSQYIYTI